MRMVFGDFSIFRRAEGKFGMAEKLELPEIKWKSEEFGGGGQMVMRDIGLILDKLEMKWSLNSYEVDMLSDLASPGQTSSWKVMGSMIVPGSPERPFKVQVTGALMELKRGELAPGKKTETEFMVKDIIYYQEIVDGRELFEIDVLNQVLRINGVDRMAARRRNLGR